MKLKFLSFLIACSAMMLTSCSSPTLATTEAEDYIAYSEWGDNVIQNSTGYTWRTLTNEENVYPTQNGTAAAGISGNSKRLHPHSDGDLFYGDCVRLVHSR